MYKSKQSSVRVFDNGVSFLRALCDGQTTQLRCKCETKPTCKCYAQEASAPCAALLKAWITMIISLLNASRRLSTLFTVDFRQKEPSNPYPTSE